jgi:hypothetical protein
VICVPFSPHVLSTSLCGPPFYVRAAFHLWVCRYVARRPLNRLAEAAKEALRASTRTAWLNAHPLFVDLDTPDAAPFFEPSLDPNVVPQLLYAPSRAPAVRKGASWADRTDHVQWLPVHLAAFDRRLRSAS